MLLLLLFVVEQRRAHVMTLPMHIPSDDPQRSSSPFLPMRFARCDATLGQAMRYREGVDRPCASLCERGLQTVDVTFSEWNLCDPTADPAAA